MKANTVETLEGLFKEVYGDDVLSMLPNAARVVKDFPFVSRDKQEGNAYNQPVRLTRAHGWTLSTAGDAFALHPPEPALHDNARIQGSSFVLRDAISLDAAAKLSQSGKDKRAFVAGTSHVVENMTETAAFVLELQCLYGQSSLGTINARTADNGTSQTFSVTAATFVAAIWSGLERGYVEIWTSNGVTNLTPSGAQITAVDIENLKLTLEGVETQLDAVAAATNPLIYLRDTKSAGMVGLRSQIANSGSLFGIDAANYSLWAGNTYSISSAAASFVHIMRAMNKPIGRGLMGDYRFYMNPSSWTDVMNDLAALRRLTDKAGGGDIKQGGGGLEFYCQSGSVELVPHIFIKPSEMMGMPKGKGMRLGASEMTFNMPGVGKVWENLPDHAGVGIRCYWNQAIFLPCPAQCVLIDGLVNTDQSAA